MEFGVPFIESTSYSVFCFFSILMHCLLADRKKDDLGKKLRKIFSPHPHPLWSSGVAVKITGATDLIRREQGWIIGNYMTWEPWWIFDETTGTKCRRVIFSSGFDFFGIFGLVYLSPKTFRRNMDNLIFYLAKMALVLAFLATTPTRGRKEDGSLKLCL